MKLPLCQSDSIPEGRTLRCFKTGDEMHEFICTTAGNLSKERMLRIWGVLTLYISDTTSELFSGVASDGRSVEFLLFHRRQLDVL